MKRYIITLITLFYTAFLYAGNESVSDGMANVLRSSGKIYVVISVIVTIFTGIAIYLITIDRKVSKLEKEVDRLK